MRWVTRRGAGFGALASAWLIRRFIDRDAAILFAEDRLAQQAVACGFLPFPSKPSSDRLAPVDGAGTAFSELLKRFDIATHPLESLAAWIPGSGNPKAWKSCSVTKALAALDAGLKENGDGTAEGDAENLRILECILDALHASLLKQSGLSHSHSSDVEIFRTSMKKENP